MNVPSDIECDIIMVFPSTLQQYPIDSKAGGFHFWEIRFRFHYPGEHKDSGRLWLFDPTTDRGCGLHFDGALAQSQRNLVLNYMIRCREKRGIWPACGLSIHGRVTARRPRPPTH